MATISTYIESKTGVLFTAPFDCVIGIDVKHAASVGGYLQKKYSGTNEQQVFGSTSTGSKITSVIMKTGDQIFAYANVYYSLYITGVSA